MKKLFAIILAVTMLTTCVIAASAAKLSDIDSPNFWGAHTEGVAIDADGVEITFTNTTYETATDNWNGPLWILYTASEAKVNGADYVEYWVERGDIYGWTGATNTGDMAAVNALGITHEAVAPDWEAYKAALKAGAEGKVVAKRVEGNIVITMEIAGASSTVTVPVPADKTAYVSLSGEMAKLTNINTKSLKVEVDNDPTGDIFGTVVAMMAVSGLGITVLAKKKF